MSFFSLFCTCKSIQNESQNVGKLHLGALKLREKDVQYRQNCPRGASMWFKARSGVGKGVRWPPRGPPRTHLGTQLGVHLVSLGRQNESTEPVLKQNSVPERVQECQKCIKWKSAKTLKNLGFSMVFNGFSWCRGIFFDVFFVKFCENSISWEKLSGKLWFGAQGNVFFVKMKRRMSQKELQRAAWRAPGGHGTDKGNRGASNFGGLIGP